MLQELTGKAAQVFGYFTETPEGQAIVAKAQADEAAKRAAARRAAVAQIAEIEAVETRAIAAHAKAVAPLQAREDALRAEIARVQHQRLVLEAERRSAAMRASQQADRARGVLEQTKPAAIEAFCQALSKDIAHLFKHEADQVRERGIDGKFHTYWSNRDSLHVRANAMTEAMRTARLLVYEALDDDELAARFAQLRAALPAVEPRPAQYPFRGEA